MARAFIPPVDDPVTLWISQRLLPLALGRERIRLEVSEDCLATLAQLRGRSTVVLVNHSDRLDPLVAFALSKEAGENFYYLAARELFDVNAGFNGWVLRHCGAYSVIRGGNDTCSAAYTISIIARGRRKLIMFPEGDVTGFDRDIGSLKQDGMRNILEAQARLQQDHVPVYLLPLGFYYRVANGAEEELHHALLNLEQHLGVIEPGHTLEQRLFATLNAYLDHLERYFGVVSPVVRRRPPYARLKYLVEHATVHISSITGADLRNGDPGVLPLHVLRAELRRTERHFHPAPETTCPLCRQLHADYRRRTAHLLPELSRLQKLTILGSTLQQPLNPNVLQKTIGRLEELLFGTVKNRIPLVVRIEAGSPISLLNAYPDYREDPDNAARDLASAARLSMLDALNRAARAASRDIAAAA